MAFCTKKITHAKKIIIFTLLSLVTISCGGGSDGDEDKFKITNVLPDDGLGVVSVSSKVEVNFNKAVAENTITENTFWLLDEHTHEKVDGKLEVSGNKKTVSFTPKSLFYDRHYRMTVHHSVTDADGNHLAPGTKDWSFFTQSRPPIFQHFPDLNDENINTNVKIQVEFENPIQSSTLNNFSFILQDAFLTNVQGSVNLITPTQAEFSPALPLNLGSQYTVTLTSDILDAQGVSVFQFPFSWRFTTRLTPSSTFNVGTNDNDEIFASALDSQESILLAGRTDGQLAGQISQGEYDAIALKYDALGNQQWATQFGTPLFDTITGLLISQNGNIYLSGHSDRSQFGFGPGLDENEQSDIFLTALDPNGVQLWTQTFGAIDGHDFSTGLVLDSLQNIYVAGESMGSVNGNTNLGGHDLVLAKYSPDGNPLWTKQTGTEGEEHVNDIVILNDTIYIAVSSSEIINPGDTGIPPPPGIPFFFAPNVKAKIYTFDSQGNQLGENTFTDDEVEQLIALKKTNDNKLVVAARAMQFSEDLGFGTNAGIIYIIDTNFNIIAEKSFLTRDQFDLEAITLDTQNNIYVAGTIYQQNFGTPGSGMGGGLFPPGPPTMQLQVQKISALDQSIMWTALIDVASHSSITSMEVTAAGDIIATGFTHGGIDGNSVIGAEDGFVLRLDANGNLN